MLHAFMIFFLMTPSFLFAQNVGIGTNTPTEKLHVNGNINVTGTIKANGVAGLNNQVLRTNSSGNLVWDDISDYTYVVSFTQDLTWTVPAGVTQLLIEAWGAGGGGAAGGGGSGGTFVRGAVTVTPGAIITIDTGPGGAAAGTEAGSAVDGGNTLVSGPTFTSFTAQGGNGATATEPGFAMYSGSATGLPYLQFAGQSGRATTFSYAQVSATEFYEIRNYGGGGATAPLYNNGAAGATRVLNAGTGIIIKTITSTFSSMPGAGGAGGPRAGIFGTPGATGVVVIHY